MKALVRILHLEDNPVDAELCRGLLAHAGLACEIVPARGAAEFRRALARGGFDLILADHQLPDYDGLRALADARDAFPDVPFVLISGDDGEESAVAALKAGATDYVKKSRMSGFVPAIRRAFAEAGSRAGRKHPGPCLAVLDATGVILSTNHEWREFVLRNDPASLACGEAGENYLDACRRAASGDNDTARALARIESVLRGDAAEFMMEYVSGLPGLERRFLLHVARPGDGQGGAVLSHSGRD